MLDTFIFLYSLIIFTHFLRNYFVSSIIITFLYLKAASYFFINTKNIIVLLVNLKFSKYEKI